MGNWPFLVDIKTESIEPIRMDREPLWCSRSERTSRTTSSFVLMTSWLLVRSSECADVKWIRGNFILKLVGQGRDVLLMRELSNFPLLPLRPSLLRWKKNYQVLKLSIIKFNLNIQRVYCCTYFCFHFLLYDSNSLGAFVSFWLSNMIFVKPRKFIL